MEEEEAVKKEIERLWKIQDRLNKRAFHLHIETNLVDKYVWALYLYMPNIEDYFSSYNRAILDSTRSNVEELEFYLSRYDGFDGRW